MAFAGATVDRAPRERRQPGWLAARRAEPGARSLVVSERGLWLDDGHLLLVPPNGDAAFLGLVAGRPLFAGDAASAEPQRGRPTGLREAATELPAEEAALGAYAASLLSWHRRHRFCANCGHPTESVDAGHERWCRACDAHHFPRTDPVVIVRVVDPEDRLLLGRQASWPAGRFSVLAGFVEPGETLEEAVRREVLEESGIEVDGAAYLASQPWPFPSSLMLGFGATSGGGEPRPGDGELAEVRWFDRAEVEASAAGQSELRLPPPYSIARRLIDAWLRLDPDDPDRPRRSW
jgi:NAD+ diphosphatase